MHRLSPLDASFLHIENDENLMHIGSVGVFEGPPPEQQDMLAMIAGRLPEVPRYRQRVRMVPFDLGRPVWVDDTHFDLAYHVRRSALPRPGGSAQLRALASRIASQHLDRARPLWELWVVEGLEDDHWALISKTHHSMVDGISGTDLLATLLDAGPDDDHPEAREWTPEASPSALGLAAGALVDQLTSPAEQLRAVRSLVRRPRDAAKLAAATAKGLASFASGARPVTASKLIGPISPTRSVAHARASLADVKRIRAALGGTINDVILTAVTKGYADLLRELGEDPSTTTLRSLVPVSVRRPEQKGQYDNQVSAMVAELPVGVDDPVERLAAIREQMDRLKQSGEAVAGDTLTRLGTYAPPLLLALGTRAATTAMRQLGRGSLIHTVTTNVPGPQRPLYALGRRMLEAFPYVCTASPLRVGVAIFSYDGQFGFGVNADFDHVGDPGVLARGIETGMAELIKAAEAVEGEGGS
jgi:WS/DGAT/MGAT family acyltransferase